MVIILCILIPCVIVSGDDSGNGDGDSDSEIDPALASACLPLFRTV